VIVKLVKVYKNHPAGSVLDVSQGVYSDLVKAGCVAAVDASPKERIEQRSERSSRVRHKSVEVPAADKMIREAETK